MTIVRSGTMGETMTNDKMQQNVDARVEQAEPKQTVKRAPVSQASAADPPRQPAAPGRRPLFRN